MPIYFDITNCAFGRAKEHRRAQTFGSLKESPVPWYAIRTVYHFRVRGDGTNIFEEERGVSFEASGWSEAHAKAETKSQVMQKIAHSPSTLSAAAMNKTGCRLLTVMKSGLSYLNLGFLSKSSTPSAIRSMYIIPTEPLTSPTVNQTTCMLRLHVPFALRRCSSSSRETLALW